MHRASKRRLVGVVVAAAMSLVAVPIVILWAWNIALPDLLGLPMMDYRNALGLAILGLAVAIPLRGHRWVRRVSCLSEGRDSS